MANVWQILWSFHCAAFSIIAGMLQKRKKIEMNPEQRESKQTGRQADWKQNKKTTVQCANKVKLNHVHTKCRCRWQCLCRSRSRESLSAFFGPSLPLSLSFSLSVCRFQHSPGAIWQLVTKATTEIPTNDSKYTGEILQLQLPLTLTHTHRSTTWPHGSHFDIKDYTQRQERAV